MFKRIFIHELKSVKSDSLYLFLAVFPLIISGVSAILIPYMKENTVGQWEFLVTATFILLNGFMFGAVIAFSLLDDQDDKVLLSLRITPISVRWYIGIKLLFGYIFGVLATLLIMISTGTLFDLSAGVAIMILILAPMQAPIYTLLIVSLANNKVEGFVFLKSTSLLLIAPAAGLFLSNWTELLLSPFPAFWTTKLIVIEQGLHTYLSHSYLYFAGGIIAHVIIGYLLFNIYAKKHQLH